MANDLRWKLKKVLTFILSISGLYFKENLYMNNIFLKIDVYTITYTYLQGYLSFTLPVLQLL